jgi:plastocyanin
MALALVLAACGGGDDATKAKDDAATTPSDGDTNSDAPPVDSTPADAGVDAHIGVLSVTCDGSEVETVTTTAPSDATAMFTPDAITISQNDVVKFIMPSAHNVVPDPTADLTDPGLRVNFNQTKCLQFTETGTFGYKCGPHGFKGTVTVQ